MIASEEGDTRPLAVTFDNKPATYPLSENILNLNKGLAGVGDGESAYAVSVHYHGLGNIEKAIYWAEHAANKCKICPSEDAQRFLNMLHRQKKGDW